MSWLIAGDIVPGAAFETGDVTALLDEALCAVWQAADKRLANLECPLTDRTDALPKNGPHLKASPATGAGLAALSLDLVTLANNHCLDYGEAGLTDTLGILRQHGITSVGVGTCATAGSAVLLPLGDKTVGIYACAEPEFSGATETTLGANAPAFWQTLTAVRTLRARCDGVVVLYHGGKERYPYPSPEGQARCRALVEAGATLVLCQHSHCIGCHEQYQDGTIVYGQGNFLFEKYDDDLWNTGFLVTLHEDFSVTFVPYRQQNGRACLLTGADADAVLAAFARRSEDLHKPGVLKQRYAALADEYIDGYLLTFCRRGPLFRAVNKLSGYRFGRWYLRHKFPPAKRRMLYNLLTCDSLRELFARGLQP